ncbi:MAG: phytanoyl-CoA dioxygenase family protein [Thermoanaerobaculia bacterium]
MPQPPSHPSLVIVGDVGSGKYHVGDEAMLAANLEILRRHDSAIHVTVIGRAESAFGEREVAAVLDQAGGLFISGGGNLSSSWPDLVRQRVLWMSEARRRGLPVVTGGQTIGPDLTTAERSSLAETLAKVDHLGVRERPSAALALELGVPPERLSYQPDDAFFLAGRPPARKEAPGFDPELPFLAITLDGSFGLPSSRAGLARLAAQLAGIASESGLHPVFLPHVGPLGSVGDEDGLAGIALRRLLRAEGVGCMLLPVMPLAATVWVTQRAALVVSSRYHPLVFGTAAAVPCLGLYRDAYTRIKLRGALTHVGMEAWCLSATAADEGRLLAGCRHLWQRRDEVRTTMCQARARLASQEAQRWRLLGARLGWPVEPREEPDMPSLGWLTGLAGEVNKGNRIMAGNAAVTEQQWNQYARDGFLHLGKILEPEELEVLRQRADDLAMGVVWNPEVQMQLDTGGVYEELPAATRGFAGGTRLYRKIQGLETDEHFSRLVRHPLCLEICAHEYGAHAPISIFRAMVMNKPAGQGTVLPWHQDGGAVWALDRDPLVTVWVALDSATQANGCLEVIPGSHRLGLLSTFGSTVRPEDVERHCPAERVHPLEVAEGHAVLLHNWLIHRSGVNPTSIPRRAFTVCYMDGRTQSILTGNHFPVVAGSVPTEPYPYVRQLRDDNAHLHSVLEGRKIRRGVKRLAKGLLRRVRARLTAGSQSA